MERGHSSAQAVAGLGRSSLLDHAEHDGADEGHGEVRGDYAQSPGERHEVASSIRTTLRAGLMVNRESLLKKVSLAVARSWRVPARAGPYG